ncbi:MAG: gliding motility-associated C-terminal domain-containing protein [Saprospiraceae bacterium]|nr:gliding motility-associated C-terminal domain-containing protein [Lewinella sp.]
MKSTLFLLTFVCLLVTNAELWSQRSFLDLLNGYETWDNHAIAPTPDQGFLIANDLKFPPQDWEKHGFYISKYDSCGVISWARAYGSPDFALYFTDLKELSGGDVVAMGQTGFDDLFLMRINAGGEVVSMLTFDTSNGDQNYNVDVHDGKIMVFGSYYAENGAHNYLLMINETGQINWAKSYHRRRGSGAATFSSDGNTICVNGNLIYLVDEAGNLVWSRELSQLSAEDANISRPVESGNGYVLAVRNPESEAQYLFKLDQTGEVEWQSEQVPSGFLASSIDRLSDGNLVMVNALPLEAESNYGGAPFMIECSPDGEILAQFSFDLGDIGRFTAPICRTGDQRSVTVMGSYYDQGNYDYVIRLKPGEALSCAGYDYTDRLPEKVPMDIQTVMGTATNLSFTSTDTVTVDVLDLDLFAEHVCETEVDQATLEYEARIQCTDTLHFQPPLENATYLWEDGSTVSNRILQAPGQYFLQATTCRTEFDISIDLQQGLCPCNYYIPNAFSPNSDGVNDVFQAYATCEFRSYELQIFNRWGELLYQSSIPEQGWDGHSRGQVVSQGVYTYSLRYSWEVTPGVIQDKLQVGTVALIR